MDESRLIVSFTQQLPPSVEVGVGQPGSHAPCLPRTERHSLVVVGDGGREISEGEVGLGSLFEEGVVCGVERDGT